ncbi:hypothetical protein F2Q69_00011828 [Brassica cretica]|uniref:Uncharacterized protein n=1 Tax=Brassica cretica TaxID=69181 RepID=A0A8S9QJF7_BRACR|nr:hypothetical protein F2Q69_00011828 [Brassica cretica]
MNSTIHLSISSLVVLSKIHYQTSADLLRDSTLRLSLSPRRTNTPPLSLHDPSPPLSLLLAVSTLRLSLSSTIQLSLSLHDPNSTSLSWWFSRWLSSRGNNGDLYLGGSLPSVSLSAALIEEESLRLKS